MLLHHRFMISTRAEPFSECDRAAVYRAIETRRDVRSHFLPHPVPDDLLARLLAAAHHAPSVGFSQPWDFVIVTDLGIRRAIKAAFERENVRAAQNYTGERQDLYRSLKLEGILESPVNLCITCNRTRGGEHVLGKNNIFDADLFSTCCAVQNLWLAARAEGVGVGWVTIIDPSELATLLQMPAHVVPVAYLCIGYVTEFADAPDLERAGWAQRAALDGITHRNRWGC